MNFREDNINQLLKARSEIDQELRRHKTHRAVLFTDVVGSTTYFDRFGDTAGLLLLHRHDRLVISTVEEFQGIVIKTIGDSVMAEFPEPILAVRAAVETQRRLLDHNQSFADSERLQIRIGINSGVGFRRGNDLFGEVVNVAARVTKRSGPSQILVSRPVYEATLDTEICCNSLGQASLEGKAEREELYEVIWGDPNQEKLRSESEPVRVRTDSSLERAPVSARYEILDRVGAGGMGVVFKALDRETGELVALKVLKPEIADAAAPLEGLKNELRLARKITHKNVCRIHDFTRDAGATFISMEFVEGESLRRVLNRFNALSARQGIKFAQQICDGLREAHAQGIMHRDIKPENLMIDAAGNAKLMDFGLAHLIAEGSTGTVGTPAYMAPEQAQGEPIDQRADIYAFGLVLFEIFTGSAAFTAETAIEVALKQIREAPPNPRDIEQAIPEHIERAILRCLEKDPAKRFQSVEELQTALLGEPVTSQKDLAPRRKNILARSAPAKLPRVWAAVGLAMLIGVFITGLLGFNPKMEAKQEVVQTGPAVSAVSTAEVAAFRMADSLDTGEAWNIFVRNYPAGQLVSTALERLDKLRALEEEKPKTPPAPPVTKPASEPQRAPKKVAVKAPAAKPRLKWTALFDTASIPGGVFMMGNDGTREDEKPRHQVRVDGFRMSQSEITNRQYLAFLEDTGIQRPKDPAFAKNYLLDYPDLPVVNVNYQDAAEFCKWATAKFGTTIRLPTEAEWEYAALGHKKDSIYPWGFGSPYNVARFKGNEPRGVMTVARDAYPPNAFGLYNMSGNVWEWVSDFYSRDYYTISPVKNPAGSAQGTKRVIRGGSWADDETQLRSARRGNRDPNERSDRIGFRIVVESAPRVGG
ncbi:MAG TPA: SUMF1/EgtB/PvdO family nonheme iron enzyme [Terriglobia bacterium]|nr:SUMF1/EgtB/PvdO family nonheme iron enzyme [Terriglobia bacterium]